MLFNSYEFILFFLPITLAGFIYINNQFKCARLAIIWLILVSLFFYSWWSLPYLGLLLVSALFNHAISYFLAQAVRVESVSSRIQAKGLLYLGIFTNLSLLGYYKYARFFVENLQAILGYTSSLQLNIKLPLAISFFTFQQIAYLVDVYKGEIQKHNFLDYLLLIVFFPQLIAGPIVRYQEVVPQFSSHQLCRIETRNLAIGLTIFSIGLFKKVMLADQAAVYATPVFEAAEQGVNLSFLEAWCGVLAYTFQLYFDFSGYSDMAIGIANLFGVRLPLNFNSPYKSRSIIEFWRRWHITLSNFLRDYLYIPLGGNRQGKARHYLNLLITMLLGGLWHGAGWTFVIWGGLHGCYLVINHLWNSFWRSHDALLPQRTPRMGLLSWLLTFLAIVVSWVFFRAQSLGGAFNLLYSMFSLSGFALANGAGTQPAWTSLQDWQRLFLPHNLIGSTALVWLLILAIISFWAPNTYQLTARYYPATVQLPNDPESKVTQSTHSVLIWNPTVTWGVLIGLLNFLSMTSLARPSEFLYFQF